MKKIIWIIVWISLSMLGFGQIFSSIKCTPLNNVLGNPVIRLNSNDQLLASFDEISLDARSLEYRFVLCDANWKTASLQPIQFMSGMNYSPISDIRFSINTRTDYTHYEFAFPDEHTRFLVSGNYKCEIYDVNDSETTLLTIHFFVTEEAVAINAKVIPPKRVEFRRSKHELEFDITSLKFDLLQPYQNLTVLVQQNGRTDQVRKIQPQYIVGKTLKFADTDDLIFDAGNEFRNFDTKFLNFNSTGVENISILDNQYYVLLYAGESRATKVYTDFGDIFGKFVIRADRRENPEIEAEYTAVLFSLFTHYQGENASVHVFGELTDWAIDEHSEMEYDLERKCYTKVLFLKQGFYDYQYVWYDKTSETVDITRFEGNHQETLSEYTIYVYYRGNSDHHDRLIGVTTLKSHE